MRKTQHEQVKKATKAYLMALNNPSDAMSTHRFAVYLSNGKGTLDVLWPGDSDEGKQSKELLSCQVYTTRRQYPAYHFALSGCGYSKEYDIMLALRAINPKIEVLYLGGYSPSSV